MLIRLALIINLIILALAAAPVNAAELQGPYAKVREKAILVSTSIRLEPALAEEVRKGVQKEIVFYVDLFRIWQRWPDEFILGRKITQTLKCDPVKNENIATSTIESKLYQKRFTTCDELMAWALSLRDVEISEIVGLDAGEYYIRVTAESRIRELPPFINLLLFFVDETEFKLTEDSPSFPLMQR